MNKFEIKSIAEFNFAFDSQSHSLHQNFKNLFVFSLLKSAN